MKERDYYPAVERFAREYLGCFVTAADTGTKLGRVDVVGLRDTGGRLSGEGEVVAIEVKRGRSPFLASIGQAAAYSVLADRCYFADVRESWTETEREVAQELRVGLLTLHGGSRPKWQVELDAPRSTSVTSLRAQLVEKLHHSTCTICRSFFRRGESGNFRANVAITSPRKAAESDKGFLYWLEEQDSRKGDGFDGIYTRRYVCPGCVAALWPAADST